MRCPVCKAENGQGPTCRRCKADLSLMVRLEECRNQLLAAAAGFLRAGQFTEARHAARRAHELRRDADSARLVALASLLLRDFAAAWGEWPRQMNDESKGAAAVS
jgi:hypothetical protein